MRAALHILATRRPKGGELELNRELFLCILDVNRANQRASDDWFDYPPSYETRNPPTPDTEDSASERKVPDICWGYLDHEEPDPRRSARNFVIECKRLGSSTPSGWVFNVRYVTDGVQRFIDPDWRYGKDVASGAMVGYIESMTADDILAEVNTAAVDSRIPPIRHLTAAAPLHELDHVLARTFRVNPFRLIHLWIEAPSP
jgi:hypothetical protein